MQALTISPPSREARRIASDAAKDEAEAFSRTEAVELNDKPRWARFATRKGVFAPEILRPGTYREAPTKRGHGPRKRFAAT